MSISKYRCAIYVLICNHASAYHREITKFIGASGLPKMDVVGSADPYFVANIDEKISFVCVPVTQSVFRHCLYVVDRSAVKANTLAPVWNEIWRVKNVPASADLHVEVLDKDDGAPHDDFVGKFKTSVSAGAKEAEIEGPIFRRARGTFWIKVSVYIPKICKESMMLYQDRKPSFERRESLQIPIPLRWPYTLYPSFFSSPRAANQPR